MIFHIIIFFSNGMATLLFDHSKMLYVMDILLKTYYKKLKET